MRTILVTGFPGSGKTTFLLSLVARLKGESGPERAYIVLAESGNSASDEALREASPYPIVDLTRGCVGCTTMAANLLPLLEDCRSDPHPPVIFVESSSLSFKSIKNIIRDSFPGEDPPLSILVVDPELWESQLEASERLAKGMAKEADFILLNPKNGLEGLAPGASPGDSSGVPEALDHISKLKKSFSLSYPHRSIGVVPLLGAPSENLDAVLGFLGLSAGEAPYKGAFAKEFLKDVSLAG
jgi:hypothetical protein